MSVSSDESLIATGAADSVITFWKDCTEEKEMAKRTAAEQTVLRYLPIFSDRTKSNSVHREQDYMNFIAMKDYRSAISLALALDQPGRLLTLFKEVLFLDTSPETLAAQGLKPTESYVDAILQNLPPEELVNLLRHVRDWNANGKTYIVAQGILHALLRLRRVDDLSEAFLAAKTIDTIGDSKAKKALSFSELVKALIPYTERHLARLDRLVQDSYVLDYVLGEMDGGLITDGDVMDIDV